MSDKLSEIEARLKAATPGPWKIKNYDGRKNTAIESADVVQMDEPWRLVASLHITAWKPGKRNAIPTAELIANAPTDIAFLLAEVKKTENLLKKSCEDWAETDTNVKEMLKPLGINTEGDSYGFKTVEECVEDLVTQHKSLRAALEVCREAFAKIKLSGVHSSVVKQIENIDRVVTEAETKLKGIGINQ